MRVRTVSALFIALIMLFCVSCGESGSDDSAMTKALLDSYMTALCDYDLSGMNQCCMAGLEPYGDGEAAVKSCRSIAGRMDWESESIVISGSSATARLRMTAPADIPGICASALDDAVKSLDEDPDADPAELLASGIRKRAGKADVTAFSAEVTMAKVGNQWFIVRSPDVNRLLSEIRTPVAAAFAILGK